MHGRRGSSGAAAPPVHCRYAAFDVNISAGMRLPKQPADGRWGPEEVERRRITRPGLPAKCSQKDRISVVMKGDPNSADFRQWMVNNEKDHVDDIKAASDQFLVPDHTAILALRGAGADNMACSENLKSRFGGLAGDNIVRFIRKVGSDIVGRDVPGGHKFDATFKDRNDCDNLEIMLKKTPPPARRGGR